MILNIGNLPNGVDERYLRKCIGTTLNQLFGRRKFVVKKYKRNGGHKGKLIMDDERDGRIQHRFLNPRIPIICKDKPLVFSLPKKVNAEEHKWEIKKVRAQHEEDVESDYEMEEVGAKDRLLILSQVSCGAWDGEGNYVDAWRRRCDGKFDCISIDEDKGYLSIGFPKGCIRINLYDIKYSISDVDSKHYYLVLRGLPIFISYDDEFDERRFVRVPDFGHEHAHCAKYSYVFRLKYTSQLQRFLKVHKRRLTMPDKMNIVLSAISVLTSKNLEEDLDGLYRQLPFDTAFQIQALVTSWHIMPVEVSVLRQSFLQLGQETGAARVKALAAEIKWRDPRPGQNLNRNIAELQRLLLNDPIQTQIGHLEGQEETSEIRAKMAFFGKRETSTTGDTILIHSLTVSPAGMQLSGPHRDPGNRILRKFPGLDNQYLRVSFRDEMGEPFKDRKGVDSDSVILYQRFRKFLNEGVIVAGVKFEFLAFSNSQLKSHSCWFVRSPLIVDGTRMLTAQNIRKSIGNLTSIKCPPRFAARLGQAFTTTIYSINVPRSQIKETEDIVSACRRYKFSDGVGRISLNMVNKLNRVAAQHGNSRSANVFQIRLDGAKGVLALDTRMQGDQIVLRKSMIKFRSADQDLELAVAKADTIPGACYLNRPLIALLETLQVPFASFKQLQDEALRKIEAASQTPVGASRLLHELGLGLATRTSTTFKSLTNDFGFDMEDLMGIPFLRDLVRTALFHSLRSIKYKARIPVPKGYTLMGALDETNTLRENEVYACLKQADGSRTFLQGSLLVFRSPTLHPGDVQFPIAIGSVPQSSPLFALTNCLIFSSKGRRPIPSMLAGGDLDGDLYSVIMDKRIYPKYSSEPAEYLSVEPVDIGRQVKTEDITDFFLKHIVSDKVGMLATKHLVVSDQSEDGVYDEKCLRLAELYSTALDYPKTGVLPNLNGLPTTTGTPDYMQSEFRTEEREGGRANDLKMLGRNTGNYYKSNKTLGRLFRAIEVPRLFLNWGLDRDSVSISSQELWKSLFMGKFQPANDRWMAFLPYHRTLVDLYYQAEDDLANGFHSAGRTASLSTAEVFLGCTEIKSPYQSRKQMFEMTESLKSQYKDMVQRFLEAAACASTTPTGEEEEEEDEGIDLYLRKSQLDKDDYLLDDEESDRMEVETQMSWKTLEESTMDGRSTHFSQYGEERKAKELHLKLYSLFALL